MAATGLEVSRALSVAGFSAGVGFFAWAARLRDLASFLGFFPFFKE